MLETKLARALASVKSLEQVFPEALLQHLLNTRLHSYLENSVAIQQMFTLSTCYIKCCNEIFTTAESGLKVFDGTDGLTYLSVTRRLQKPKECLTALVTKGAPKTLGVGIGSNPWDPGGHYYTESLLLAFIFMIWAPGGSLSSAVTFWFSAPSP